MQSRIKKNWLKLSNILNKSLRINKIGLKLKLYSFILILLAVLFGAVFFVYVQKTRIYYDLRSQGERLFILNQKLFKSEKNFIDHDAKTARFFKSGEGKNLDEYQRNYKQIRNLLDNLETNPLSDKLAIKKNLEQIKQHSRAHHKVFMTLVDQLKRRGFKEYGLEGKMRAAIHELMIIKSLDQNALLNLRRHEKDFMLRKDMAYAQKVDVEIEKMIQNARNYLNTSDEKDRAAFLKLSEKINLYQAQFKKIIAIEQSIGFDEKSGLKSQLNQTTHQIERELALIDLNIDKKLDVFIEGAFYTILFYLSLVLCFVIFAAIYFSNSISAPIVGLDRIARSVTIGLRNQEEKLDHKTFKRNDEIGSLASNFKAMLVKLKNTIKQSDEKNQKLEAFAQEEVRRLWHSEGLTIFNEILRNSHENLNKQAFEVISELVKYTKSNQGGLFVVNRENPHDVYLELKGCYAYERKKYQEKRINLGEGLVGTAWKEQKTILITDIPQDYVYISSGLGKARPNCLLIIPIRSGEAIEGVIELISFSGYQAHEINFIEALSLQIGSSIVSLKANEQTRKLLAATEDLAKTAQEKEAQLQKQLEDYQSWVQEFESRISQASEEALIYQSIVGRVYTGLIVTDATFKITQLNEHVSRLFGYDQSELIGEAVDVLIESNHDNILDLKDKRFRLNFQLFSQNVGGKIINRFGEVYEVELMCGKLELESKTVYVFMFNQLEEAMAATAQNVKLKVAS
ncbi:MAG: GAF domain-containing protein [Microscillaceae bacterium]|nr:GAF domain-containing protein [Microscillaceae bacterium]